MPQPATLVEGKYEVLAKIREGGMGTIYKVRHRLLDEIRVIKVIRPSVAADEEFRKRFIDEAKTATRLKHPNICAIYDFALDPDGSSSLVMEYIDGVTLSDLLRAQGSLDIALALEITHQTLLALGYLHRKKIVHRDIAPDNLMLTVDDDGKSVVKLIDLGIAKVLDKGGGELTSTGQFLGKLRYASPEQYGSLPRGMTIDGRSDLYSMGLVLYEILTGTRPFAGETPIELMRAHVYQEPLPFEESDPRRGVPEDVRQIVLRALRKNREERFASAQDFDVAIVASLALVDRQAAAEEGPTLILGLKSQIRTEEPTQTPSAQDRLDFQFAPQKTPTVGPTTPMGSRALVDAFAEARASEAQELAGIREREAARDVAGLNRLDAQALSPAAGAELRGALERLARQEAKERGERESADWAAAVAAASAAAWDAYLAAHPESARRTEATRLRDEARAFDRAAAQESHGSWTAFLASWPEGAHRAQALAAIQEVRKRDEQALRAAVEAGTAQALRDFLAAYQDSSREDAAKSFLAEQTDFDAAAAQDAEGPWRQFLERWPSGLRAAAASLRLKAALQREQLAWKEANEDGTAAVLRKFLSAHPSGKHHHEAEGLLRELAELDAAREGGIDGYQAFLRKYPTSRHARDVRHKIRELEERTLLAQMQQQERALDEQALERILLKYPPGSTELGSAAAEALARVRVEKERRKSEAEETEWALASSGKREEDWKRFLKKHPDSRHADEARRGLAQTIEAKMREAHEQAALDRVRRLETAMADEELAETVRSQPQGSVLSTAAAEALERVRAQRERQRRQADDAEWARAAAGGEAEWQRFLESHPESSHVVDANQRLAQAAEARRLEAMEAAVLARIREHETALAADDLERLLQEQPASAAAVRSAASSSLARVKDALARRERDAEESDWRQAETEGRSATWQRFLDRHPATLRAKEARRRLGKAQNAERAAEKAMAREGAKAPGKNRWGLWISLAASAAALAVGALLWTSSRARPAPSAASPAVQPAPIAAARAQLPTAAPVNEQPTPAPPPAAAVGPGELAIDVLPWGRVDRIVDADGKGVNMALPQYTPLVVSLPPGKYSVFVTHPDHANGLTIPVEIRAGERSAQTRRFETVDANAYFRSQGWGG